MDSSWWKSSHSSESANCLEARVIDGRVQLRDTENPEVQLECSVESWRAFVAGARDGEFEVA